MSHVTTVSLVITDLAALKAAVKEQGCVWVEGKKEYTWWGVSVGDTPLPAGMTKEDLGKCDHVIRVPGVAYEIGVVKTKTGYTLAYDSYGFREAVNHKGEKADGYRLLEKFGNGLAKLSQGYAVAKATLAAKARGLMVKRETLKNGSIKLVLTGNL